MTTYSAHYASTVPTLEGQYLTPDHNKHIIPPSICQVSSTYRPDVLLPGTTTDVALRDLSVALHNVVTVTNPNLCSPKKKKHRGGIFQSPALDLPNETLPLSLDDSPPELPTSDSDPFHRTKPSPKPRLNQRRLSVNTSLDLIGPSTLTNHQYTTKDCSLIGHVEKNGTKYYDQDGPSHRRTLGPTNHIKNLTAHKGLTRTSLPRASQSQKTAGQSHGSSTSCHRKAYSLDTASYITARHRRRHVPCRTSLKGLGIEPVSHPTLINNADEVVQTASSSIRSKTLATRYSLQAVDSEMPVNLNTATEVILDYIDAANQEHCGTSLQVRPQSQVASPPLTSINILANTRAADRTIANLIPPVVPKTTTVASSNPTSDLLRPQTVGAALVGTDTRGTPLTNTIRTGRSKPARDCGYALFPSPPRGQDRSLKPIKTGSYVIKNQSFKDVGSCTDRPQTGFPPSSELFCDPKKGICNHGGPTRKKDRIDNPCNTFAAGSPGYDRLWMPDLRLEDPTARTGSGRRRDRWYEIKNKYTAALKRHTTSRKHGQETITAKSIRSRLIPTAMVTYVSGKLKGFKQRMRKRRLTFETCSQPTDPITFRPVKSVHDLTNASIQAAHADPGRTYAVDRQTAYSNVRNTKLKQEPFLRVPNPDYTYTIPEARSHVARLDQQASHTMRSDQRNRVYLPPGQQTTHVDLDISRPIHSRGTWTVTCPTMSSNHGSTTSLEDYLDSLSATSLSVAGESLLPQYYAGSSPWSNRQSTTSSGRRRGAEIRRRLPRVLRARVGHMTNAGSPRTISTGQRYHSQQQALQDLDDAKFLSRLMEFETIQDKMERMFRTHKKLRSIVQETADLQSPRQLMMRQKYNEMKDLMTRDDSRTSSGKRLARLANHISSSTQIDLDDFSLPDLPATTKQAEHTRGEKSSYLKSRHQPSVKTRSSSSWASSVTSEEPSPVKSRHTHGLHRLQCGNMSSSSVTHENSSTAAPAPVGLSNQKGLCTVTVKPQPKYYSSMPIYTRHNRSKGVDGRT